MGKKKKQGQFPTFRRYLFIFFHLFHSVSLVFCCPYFVSCYQQALRLETKEVKLAEMELSSHQSQHAAPTTATSAPDDNDADDKEDSNSADTQTKSSAFSNPEEMGMEGKRDTVDTEQQETGGGGIEANGDESKGLKRKIDTVERDDEEERSPEKKKVHRSHKNDPISLNS